MAPQTYFAAHALLDDGWQTDVHFMVEDGIVISVEKNASAQHAECLPGPVVPAMANLHSHAFQRAMAGLAEVSLNPNDSFWSWRDLMYKMVGKLSAEDVRVIATMLYIDMLKAGYTQVAEFHYLHHQPDGKSYPELNTMMQQIVAAANNTGIGVTLLPVLYSYAGFGAQPASDGQRRFINTTEDYLQLLKACAVDFQHQPKHKLGICFHSLRAVTPEQIKQVLSETEKNIPVHIHIAEQQKEVDDCVAWSGQRPVQWLIDNIGIDQRWCLVHATHLDVDEVELVAKSGAVVGLCPTTEANLGDGIFPAVEYTAAGGCWGIGSDSHVSLSVVEELRTLEYGQRLRDQKRNRLYHPSQPQVADFIYQQALSGGNQACGVALGLAVGQRADFIVLDHQHPFIAAGKNSDWLNRWIFATNNNLIRDVYVAGEVVVSNFQHPHEQQARREFTELLKRLF